MGNLCELQRSMGTLRQLQRIMCKSPWTIGNLGQLQRLVGNLGQLQRVVHNLEELQWVMGNYIVTALVSVKVSHDD